MPSHPDQPHCFHAANLKDEPRRVICCHCGMQIAGESWPTFRHRIESSGLHAAVTGREHGPFLPNEEDR